MAFLDETGLGHLWTRIMEKLGEKVGTSELDRIKSEIKAEILGAAPDELNTLEELAAALGEDENFSTTILNQQDKNLIIQTFQQFRKFLLKCLLIMILMVQI